MFDIFLSKRFTATSLNEKWHRAHKIPQNPTQEQRIDWHLEHSRNCTCRPIPPKLLLEIEKREGKKN